MPTQSPTRPLLQYSLQSLLVLMTMVAIGAAVVNEHISLSTVGRLLVHYCFLVFAVGPWFAYLASECLPVEAPQLRTAAANMILLGLFIATLKLAQATLPGPIVIVVSLAAVVLWTPQYMIFFVWRMGD
jgi:hypothetical protein